MTPKGKALKKTRKVKSFATHNKEYERKTPEQKESLRKSAGRKLEAIGNKWERFHSAMHK